MKTLSKLVKTLAGAAALAFCAAHSSATPVFSIACSLGGTSCSSFGNAPVASLLRDSSGNYYGTTQFTGDNSGGVVFKLSPNPSHTVWLGTVLFAFCSSTSCTDGSSSSQGYQPRAGLIMDSSGNLYGTASRGGNTTGSGTAFELSPAGLGEEWTLKVLHTFCSTFTDSTCQDGSTPFTALSYAGQSSGTAYDGSSALYGTTSGGGSANHGSVYQLTFTTHWHEKVLHSFCDGGSCTVDNFPESGVTLDGSGNLYGVADEGPNLHGIVYELSNAAHWPETIIYEFCMVSGCTDGAGGNANVVFDGAGNLYGTTAGGGSTMEDANGSGVVFELKNPSTFGTCMYSVSFTGWCEAVLYTFCPTSSCTTGRMPSFGTGLVMDSSGDLFGTTANGGGTPDAGVIYELSGTGLLTQTVLHTFCAVGGSSCTDGEIPQGGLTIDSSGRLYGTTIGGGSAGNNGIVYQLTP